MGEMNVKTVTSVDTPSVGYVKIFPKADGFWYSKDSAGAETKLGKTPHASDHTDGTDQIADATLTDSGLMSAADKLLLGSVSLGNVLTRVRNESGGPLSKHKLICVVGYSVAEDRPLVNYADKDNATLCLAIAILLEDVSDGANSDALVTGTLKGIDTSVWLVNDQLVLGNTGDMSIPPPAQDPFTGIVQNIGFASRIDAVDGQMVIVIDGLDTLTADQVFGLLGTSGSPSKTNRFVTDSDSRMSDARTPTAHAASHTDGSDDIQDATAAQKGLMTSTYALKLDGIIAADGAPEDVTKSVAVIGTSGDYAREDHKHDVSTATPGAATPGDSATEGTATSLARSDHQHSLPAFGTIATTFCEGDDSRLSDARTPTAHAASHTDGSDDVRDATNALKGLATASQIGVLEGLVTGNQEVDKLAFNLSAGATATEGDMVWNASAKTVEIGMPGGTALQIGQEMDLPDRPKNKQGVQIDNGQAVYICGSTSGIPEVKLANAVRLDARYTIAIATEDVANDAQGRYVTYGFVRDIDTTFGSEGDWVYLDTTDGNLTVTPPALPNYVIRIGTIITSDATNGVIYVAIDNSRGQDLGGFWSGSFREVFDALVTSNGSVVTLTFERRGGGDLTMQFSTGESVLDCVPASTVVLTAGTDTVPQANYVYIPISTKVLTVSTSQFPASSEHIKVGYFYVQSAAYVLSDGALINQNWNDPLYHNSTGHLLHITERIRRIDAQWFSGCDGQGGDDYTTSGVGSVTVQIGSGVIYQMHAQNFVSVDTSISGDVHVVNHDITPFYSTGNLYDVVNDAAGATLVNRYFNIVLIGVANKTGQYCPVLINLPNGSYNNLSDAQKDSNGYDVLSIPREFTRESSTGFLIARLTFRKEGTSWTYHSTVDLRGLTPATASGGGAGGIVTEFSDALFRITGNLDSTQKIAVSASGITTGNTRTITMPDKDVTLDDSGDARTPTAHAASHTDGSDDIRDATNALKGLATAAQITKLEGIEALADVTDLTNVAAAGALMTSLADAKGDVFVATADNTVTRLAVGTDTQVLTADSGQASGVKWATPSASVSYPVFHFFANQMDNPVTADWAVNVLAPLVAGLVNTAIQGRLFDDTTEEGVGMLIEVPTGATNIIIGLRSRAYTADASNLGVVPKIYVRELPDNLVVESWAGTALTTITMGTSNLYYQYDSQTIALSTLSMVAGRVAQIELTRDATAGADTLVGDWVLLEVKISFS